MILAAYKFPHISRLTSVRIFFMAPPIALIFNLLRDPEVDKRAVLRFVLLQVHAVGYAKVASALLGTAVVGVSLGIKIPQIKKILAPASVSGRAKLALGLSRRAVQLETLSQVIHVTYNRQLRNAFVNYGESLMLALQNMVLLAVLEYYRLRSDAGGAKNVWETWKALARPAGALLGALLFVARLAPRLVVLALQVLIIPLGVAAKTAQIRRNAALRSTASLSPVTVGANVAGALIRVFTTVSNYKRGRARDKVLLAGYLASLVTNAVIAGQMVQYGRGERRSEGEKEKEE